MPEFLEKKGGLTRRAFVRGLAALIALGATVKDLMAPSSAGGSSGMPLPDEKIDATLKRLFGNRPLRPGDGRIKLDLPLIAEDGGNVGVTVEADLPMSRTSYVSHIYLIADKNRRPLLAKFSFTPEAGKAFIATSVRLAETTDVRAVVEMNDGVLYASSRPVRVTISGCDIPAS